MISGAEPLMPIRSLLMPCSTTGLVVTVVALTISHLPLFALVEMEQQVDEARFASLCLIERPMLNVKRPNLAAAEKLWRDELSAHKCNPSRDWLHANCTMKLADVISLRKHQIDQPQPAELENLYKTAVTSFENLHTCFEAASANESLGDFYASHKKFKDAEICYKKSIDAYESKFGPYCFYSQDIITSLVQLYIEQNRCEEAIALLNKEIQALEARSTECPVAVNWVRFELGKVYFHMGRYREAEAHFKNASSRGISHLPVDSYIAATAQKLGRKDEAERHFKSIVQSERAMIARHQLGSCEWNLANALESLANFYTEAKRSTEAIPLLQEAFTIRQNAFSSNNALPMPPGIKQKALQKVARQLSSVYAQQARQAWAREVLEVAAKYSKK